MGSKIFTTEFGIVDTRYGRVSHRLGWPANATLFHTLSRVTRNCETHSGTNSFEYSAPKTCFSIYPIGRASHDLVIVDDQHGKKVLFANSVVKKHGVGWHGHPTWPCETRLWQCIKLRKWVGLKWGSNLRVYIGFDIEKPALKIALLNWVVRALSRFKAKSFAGRISFTQTEHLSCGTCFPGRYKPPVPVCFQERSSIPP